WRHWTWHEKDPQVEAQGSRLRLPKCHRKSTQRSTREHLGGEAIDQNLVSGQVSHSYLQAGRPDSCRLGGRRRAHPEVRGTTAEAQEEAWGCGRTPRPSDSVLRNIPKRHSWRSVAGMGEAGPPST